MSIIICTPKGNILAGDEEVLKSAVHTAKLEKMINIIDHQFSQEPQQSNFLKFEKPEIPEIFFEDMKYSHLTRKQREAKIISVRNSKTDPKIDRNALCPCGSGRKHKRCCGNK